MPTCQLIQTEKSYRTQQNNTYMLTFAERSFSTNKIELEKLLKKNGLNVLKITTTNTQQKTKRRGKAGKTILQFRPQKYYVRLRLGEIITEDTIKQINESLSKNTINK
jgi:ribosomal protein L23